MYMRGRVGTTEASAERILVGAGSIPAGSRHGGRLVLSISSLRVLLLVVRRVVVRGAQVVVVGQRVFVVRRRVVVVRWRVAVLGRRVREALGLDELLGGMQLRERDLQTLLLALDGRQHLRLPALLLCLAPAASVAASVAAASEVRPGAAAAAAAGRALPAALANR